MFEDAKLRKRFLISRPLQAVIGNKADHELLKPKAPYQPRTRTLRQPETEVVPGVPPPAQDAIPWTVQLPLAKIPQALASTLLTGSFSEVLGGVRKSFMPKTFDSQTYGRHFQSVLWVEEHRMEYVYLGLRVDLPSYTPTGWISRYTTFPTPFCHVIPHTISVYCSLSSTK
jgi:helicase MOV-10